MKSSFVCNIEVSLGDLIDPDRQIDLYRDQIDFFDLNLSSESISTQQNQLKSVRVKFDPTFIQKRWKMIYLYQKIQIISTFSI